ncbi:hypothetical protein [uncultured Treponema sp.]|nr:hypothetical protein [uncultured Treponema sp.]
MFRLEGTYFPQKYISLSPEVQLSNCGDDFYVQRDMVKAQFKF